MDNFIINERDNKQFREISFNPDANCREQFVEQIYDYELVLNAFKHSKTNEEFEEIINSEARTYLYDKGTVDYQNMAEYVAKLSSYDYERKDRLIMVSMATAASSTCKDCAHFTRCFAVYQQVDSRSCADDPVSDCDFFIANKFI